MNICTYNNIIVIVVPELIELAGAPWKVLPEGIHLVTLEETRDAFAFNVVRRVLFSGFIDAVRNFAAAGCATIFLDGSYVTSEPRPHDYDVCWIPIAVNYTLLDPVFWNPEFRDRQKARYLGELYPSTIIASNTGQTFLEFFQNETHSGAKKGILQIGLESDPLLTREFNDL